MSTRMQEIVQQAMVQRNNPWLNSDGKVVVDNWETVLDPSKFYQLMIDHATECVRDVLRDPKSTLSYDDCERIQTRIKEFFEVT